MDLSFLPPWAQVSLMCFLTLSYLAGHFCSNTSKPAPNTTWGKIYNYIEIFSGIYNKAKEIGIPVPEQPSVEDLLKRISELEGMVNPVKSDTVPFIQTTEIKS